MFLTNFEFWSTPWPYILLWFVVVVFSVMVEINTLQIVSIWFAASGAVSMILASVGCKPEIQIGVFFVLSAILIIASRPIVKKINHFHFRKTHFLYLRHFYLKIENSTVESLVGEEVVVTKIIKIGEIGEIKSKYERYSAIAPSVKEDILPSTKVKILEIRGNKVIVDLI